MQTAVNLKHDAKIANVKIKYIENMHIMVIFGCNGETGWIFSMQGGAGDTTLRKKDIFCISICSELLTAYKGGMLTARAGLQLMS